MLSAPGGPAAWLRPPSPGRVRQPFVRLPALLPLLLPSALLRPYPESCHRRREGGPRLCQLPPLLLHVPGRFGHQLHGLSPRLHPG